MHGIHGDSYHVYDIVGNKMRCKIDDFDKQYQEQIKRKLDSQDRVAVPVADVEQRTRNEQVPKKKVARFDGQVSIKIHSERRYLTDADGACSKYAIDALITAGVLINDNPKCIPESPRKTQSKSKEDKTIIEIYEVK